jgi:hypothetical protein
MRIVSIELREGKLRKTASILRVQGLVRWMNVRLEMVGMLARINNRW